MMLKVIKKIDWIFWASIFVGLLLLLLIVSPYFGCDDCLNTIIGRYLAFFHKIESGKDLLSSSTSCEVNYGMNGDSFGVVNPFIALLAAVLTFIAFWTQFQANKKMLRDNEKQQIERQFYEMLRIHQDNVEKLHLRISRPVQFTSKDVHEVQDEELTDINGHEVFLILRKEYDYIFRKIFSVLSNNKKESFKIAYDIFFFGKKKKQSGELQERINGDGQDFMSPCDIGKGRIYQLDHYYRHLYYMVKTIAGFKMYEPKEKKGFLKILRAQMTSDEQILLLYNWLAGSDLGGKWESVSQKQYFFSKYQMIHNIFPSNSVFSEREILGMFPHVSDKDKMDMFEHIKPYNLI